VIYYLCPDSQEPSWGTGMLYEHVDLLRRLGWDARALHRRAPFRPTWRRPPAAIDYLDAPGFAPTEGDVVVVPEVEVTCEIARLYPWRRVVFVQGSLLIVSGLRGVADYAAAGYDAAMAAMPHIAHVVERHFGLPAAVVPPFVAPFFFEPSAAPRRRRILLFTKSAYRIAGYPDHDIARALLARHLAARPDWELVELDGHTHEETAELMRTSTFLVNLNCLEAFNTAVPEAMAAGAVPVCYEAVGGREFLRDGDNALVFPNNHVYDLVARLCDLVDRFDEEAPLLARLRAGGRATAEQYTPEATAEALAAFFRHFVGAPG
jgi:hypothetical protein